MEPTSTAHDAQPIGKEQQIDLLDTQSHGLDLGHEAHENVDAIAEPKAFRRLKLAQQRKQSTIKYYCFLFEPAQQDTGNH